ncbi:bifunctional pyr operon transcriptional regulator/uracil phosphoribosyltransferase PyrR [Haploplasma axanthum]|uniref:Bifunctional protein PyrR n=1 Tax=Haploplasma axanthum TaxID=29552 RepID=A0A449BF20_HAPAX|nr:bifunctional pyr operon transcriptional regulator/uracil phosphoribosyltransferase PyrR [Haploplasma axanthum]VEU81041.1 bifunctional pyrimidine regulatory protein PyrR uracil phosphoribosyltransferase [Haploplasma axanthum]
MKEILNEDQISRTLRRLTHEIIERNNDLSNLIIVGVEKKGLPIARILQENLKKFADIDVPLFSLDITNYRDDLKNESGKTNNFNVDKKDVILVDDVLYTGRTARAAMDALIDLGRFNKLQLAVLVDRGHRELPIRADYVGKNLPTSRHEKLLLSFDEFKLYIIEEE